MHMVNFTRASIRAGCVSQAPPSGSTTETPADSTPPTLYPPTSSTWTRSSRCAFPALPGIQPSHCPCSRIHATTVGVLDPVTRSDQPSSPLHQSSFLHSHSEPAPHFWLHRTHLDPPSSLHHHSSCQNFHSPAGDMCHRVSGHWRNDASRTQLGPEWIFFSEA